MLKNTEKSTSIAIFLIFLMFLIIAYFAAIGYPNVLSIVVPITIFIGFWIWQRQEQMKRRADSAELLIRNYDYYEYELISVWKLANIKGYRREFDNESMDIFRDMINTIIAKVRNCNDAKKELDSSIKIFVRRNNPNYTYQDIAGFINEFYKLTHYLELLNKIDPLQEDIENFVCITGRFDEIDAFLRTTNFGTDSTTDCIFDKPRKAIETNTKNAFNLKFI